MIHPSARIDCRKFSAGAGTIIRAHAEIYGDRVTLGRESFVDEYAVIGGGSAGSLTAGDWFHLGMFAQVNTARPVTVGDEVGIGIGSRVFTHGAYLSEYDGFPAEFASVAIGSRVWLPNAIVMPGVTIGDDVVVAAGSVVTRDVPSGALAGGIPAKVLRERAYPNVPDRDAILRRICAEADVPCETLRQFNIRAREISGPVSESSERLRNQLRRHGIRFRSTPSDGVYVPW